MKKDKKPRGFDIQEASETEAHSSYSFAGEIDEWEPIKNNLPSFDVQSTEGSAASISYAGKVTTWTRISNLKEERQWKLACWMMLLLTAWLLCGLIAFFISGNVWLLTGLGALAIPVKTIFDHYFR